jgi:hypothetical protein
LFAAARTFFLANGHEVKTIKCPDVNAFATGFPGAIVCWLSDLLVRIFAKGSRLLIDQAITGSTLMEGSLMHGNGTKTVASQLFLDYYLEVPPLEGSSSFLMVVPSQGGLFEQVPRGSLPASHPTRYGGSFS